MYFALSVLDGLVVSTVVVLKDESGETLTTHDAIERAEQQQPVFIHAHSGNIYRVTEWDGYGFAAEAESIVYEVTEEVTG